MVRFTPYSVAKIAAQAKRRSMRIIFLVVTFLFILVSLTSEPKSTVAFSSGSGTIADPYVISNCAELQSINDDPEYMLASYVLSGNIDCTSISPFVPIGIPQTFDGNFLPFMGRFDGQGYTISNVTMGTAGDSNIGLFAETQGASIRDVVLDNVTLDAFSTAGALVARASQSAIVGISVTNSTITLSSTNSVTGGAIAGRFLDSYGYGLYASSTSVVATGSSVSEGGGMVGGLVGNMVRSTLDRSYAGVTVTADFYNVGGIVGGIYTGSVLKDLYSDSVVVGYSAVGGIVGSFSGSGGNDYVIENVYSNASTTATNAAARVGGILGAKSSAGFSAGITISNSFAVGPVSSTTYSGALTGTYATLTLINNVYYPDGTGQTRCADGGSFSASECTTNNTSTYYHSSSNAPMTSWNFADVWSEVPSNLPVLQVFPFTEPVTSISVTSCTELASNMRADPNGWFTLSNNIDCAGDSNLLPLLGDTASTSAFVGIFDGQGYTISNITMSRSAPSPQYLGGLGLFTKLFGATVSDFMMTGGGVTSLSADLNGIGGLAGYGHGLVVESVTSTVPVNTGDFSGGGLLGEGSGWFSDVHVAADVSYTYNPVDDPYGVGGIIGIGSNVIITNSSYAGSVNSYWSVGGLIGEVGLLRADGLTASGSIIGSVGVGGVVGNVYSGVNLNSYLNNSSSTVSISPNEAVDGYFEGVGGLTGRSDYLDITNGSYIGTISMGFNAYGYVGGLAGDFEGKNAATSTISDSTVDAIILSPGNNGSAPYLQNVGGLVGVISRTVEIENTIASSTITFGTDNPAEYINGFSNVGGLIGSANAFPWSITNTEASGSINIYDDYTGASGGYGYGLGGFIGVGSYGTIRSATTSVDVFLKSYESGATGGLIGDGGDFQIFDTHVIGSVTVQDPGSTYDVGGFIGYSYSNTIATSSARGDVTLIDTYGPYEIGGLLGASYDDVVQQTYTDNTVTIDMGNDTTSTGYSIGGFVGYISGGVLSNTYASTTLNITSATLNNPAATDIGGYIGVVGGSSNTITNAYSSGSLNLIADSTAPFQRVGGLIGASQVDTNIFSNLFTVTAIPSIASSTNVGGFIGSYNGGETFTANAYDATRTGQSLCTGIDGVDPAWCTVRNVGGAESNYFYISANAPQSAWDFSSIWLVRTLDYPIFGAGAPPSSTPATVLTATPATSISQTGAIVAGNITNLGSGTVTARGFAHGLTTSFGATTTESSAGFSTGVFNTALSSLVCNTTYYFSAYASGTEGLSYGSTESFTTTACGGGSTPPTVVTTPGGSVITRNTASVAGNITSLGSAAVTNRGFVYGLTNSYGATTTQASAAFPTGVFTSTLNALTCGVTYNFAAYALSADGLDYGSNSTFTTSACSNGGSTGTQTTPTITPPPPPPLPPPVVTPPIVQPVITPTPPLPPRPSPVLPNNPPATTGSPTPPPRPNTITILDEGGTLVSTIEDTDNTPESIMGESILDFDLNAIAEESPEVLVRAFEVIARDDSGNIQNSFDTTFELTIDKPDVYLIGDQLHIVKLADDGVTSTEVPFRIEGDTIRITISEPGQYFVWLLPKKAIASTDEPVVAVSASPFSFSIPLWLVTLLTALGLFSGLVALTTLLSNIPFSVAHLQRIITEATRNLFALITFKKKRQPWGTVYDSATKAPVDPAYVELFDTEGNKQAEAITDLDGRYGFLVPSGTYSMMVRKTNYLFPSKLQKLGKQDIIYSNLYQGGTFTTSSTVAHDIPMDPEVYDWNQAEKLRTKQTKFFRILDPVIVQLLDLLFFAGIVAVVVQVIVNPNKYTAIIAGLYLVLFMARMYGGKPMLYGTVLKKGIPLQFALVRVSREGREVLSKVTDKYGRYIAILEPGTYEVSVQERIGEDEYATILKRTLKTKNGTLNKSLKIS